MTLGEKIQLSRKKKGMSQEELANLLNVSRQAVQKWESGASTPELTKLVEISNVFDVSLDWLVKDVNQESLESHKNEMPNCKGERKGFVATKVFIILGMILSPFMIGGSLLKATNYSPFCLLFLLDYLVTIPIGCWSIHKLYSAKAKNETIPWGVLLIIFVSQIGGILLLTRSKSDFGHETCERECNRANTETAKEKAINIEKRNQSILKALSTISLLLRISLVGISLAVFIMLFMEQLDFDIHFFEVNGMGGGFAGYLIQIFTTVYVLLILGLTKKEKFSIFYLIPPVFLYATSGGLIAGMYNSAAPYSNEVTGLSGCAIASLALCFASYLPTILLIVIHLLIKKHQQ